MDRFDVRWLRLAVAAGAIAGTALVSSTVVAADEPPPIDETIVDETIVVVEAPADLPFEDISVIEVVIVEPAATEPGVSGQDATEAPPVVTARQPEPEALPGETEMLPVEPDAGVLPESDAETQAVPLATVHEHVEVEGDHSGDETDHGGEQGGSDHEGGQGTPYLVTFEVDWYDSAGEAIGDLDRSLFELSALSQTGSGKPTSATCTYPDDDGVLHCEFVNKGHGSESDGLIVPASKKATYTVSVVWPPDDWEIEGADDVPYSCRSDDHGGSGGDHEGGGTDHEGGDDHEGGGTDHEGGGTDHEGGGGQGDGRTTVPCVHTVVMRQLPIVVPPTEPPAVEPEPAVSPAVVAAPAAVAPTVAPVEVVEAAPVAAAAPRALPATGNSVSTLLALAGLLVAVGSSVALVSRRTS